MGLLVALSVHASSPQLVHDIYRGKATESSDPSHFFGAGRVAYFFADDGSGPALWITDGTAAGTRLLADLTPEVESRLPWSSDGGFTASGDLVYFWYVNELQGDGTELWRTDGTPAGTFRIARDLGHAAELAPIGERGIVALSSNRFLASDGTVEGTRFLSDELSPEHLVTFRGHVYFFHWNELWRTDGTDAGTTRVGGFDDDFYRVRGIVAADDAVYIVVESRSDSELNAIWRSDGTEPVHITTFREDDSDAPRLIASGGVAYALVGAEETNTGIWRLGTQAVRVTVVPGRMDSSMFLEAHGDRFYFTTDEPDALWRSDGTAAGTRLFGTIDGSWPLLVTRSKVFSVSGDAVYASDGAQATRVTPEGTRVYSESVGAVGDSIVLSVRDDAHGQELWISDGTPNGTRLLKNIRPDGNSNGELLHRFRDGLLFSAYTEREGKEPWISDGTLFGTRLLADVVFGGSSSRPALFTPLPNGRTLFVAGNRLYATDGNFTQMLRMNGEIYPGDRRRPESLPVIDGRAWVVFEDDDGPELWSTDGTPGGTQKLIELPHRSGLPLIAVDRILYFASRDALWRTDGTDAGTFALASGPEQIHAAGNRVFFTAYTTAHGRELWVTDGTLAGTHIVRDIHRGEGSAFLYDTPVLMQSAGNVLFFAADDGVHGFEPWRSDGTEAGTFLLRDVAPGEASSMLPMFQPELSAFAGGSVFFSADDGVHGYELWRTDLQRTTELVRDISPRRGSSNPTHLRAVGDQIYFSADDGRHGRELWRASTATATLVADVNAGPASSNPREMTELEGAIYFFAATEETGDELWRADPPKPPRRRSVR